MLQDPYAIGISEAELFAVVSPGRQKAARLLFRMDPQPTPLLLINADPCPESFIFVRSYSGSVTFWYGSGFGSAYP
jgi:hypothetical protein